jgi:calcineurin-like phosphoesterase family protein
MRNIVWFIGDTHFHHDMILEYCKTRSAEFSNVHQMNEELIYRWNQVVNPGDTVWHVGDFAICSGDDYKKRDTLEIIDRLNGHLRLVMGNHDHDWIIDCFDRVYGVAERKRAVISHIPVHPMQKPRFKFNIHGHLHEHRVTKRVETTIGSQGYSQVIERVVDDPWYINVSVEQQEFAPRSWADIYEQWRAQNG